MDLQESERNPFFFRWMSSFVVVTTTSKFRIVLYIDLFFILPLGILDLSEVLEHQFISIWVLALE